MAGLHTSPVPCGEGHAGAPSPRASGLHTPAPDLPLDELLARVGHDRELLITLANLLKSESPRALSEIRGCIESGDAASVERAAHRLVGSLVVFGAADAVAAGRRVEQLGRDAQSAHAHEALAALEIEIQRVIAALQRDLPAPPP